MADAPVGGDARAFAALAHAFLPAPGATGDPGEVLIWGRVRGGPGTALRRAARREIDLRRLRAGLPAPLQVTGVHRLPAPSVRRGIRGRARAVVRAGLLVEIGPEPRCSRVIDAVAAAAGAERLDGPVHAGAGGTVVVLIRRAGGERGILRVGRAGAPGDPAPLGRTLEALAAAGAGATVPRLLGGGIAAGASWIVEEALPGRRPARLTAALVRDVARVCGRLRSAAPPVALLDDLHGAAGVLDDHALALRRLARALEPRLRPLPAVVRHGDLWTGNLLVSRRHLTGIVDWDAAHQGGVPGADLVQLVGGDERRRRRRSLGAAVVDRAWTSRVRGPLAAEYWSELGLRPDDDVLDLAALAWWASEVHHTLLRFPERARDERWMEENVARVLAAR
jgi:hypothetical protein